MVIEQFILTMGTETRALLHCHIKRRISFSTTRKQHTLIVGGIIRNGHNCSY